MIVTKIDDRACEKSNVTKGILSNRLSHVTPLVFYEDVSQLLRRAVEERGEIEFG